MSYQGCYKALEKLQSQADFLGQISSPCPLNVKLEDLLVELRVASNKIELGGGEQGKDSITRYLKEPCLAL